MSERNILNDSVEQISEHMTVSAKFVQLITANRETY